MENLKGALCAAAGALGGAVCSVMGAPSAAMGALCVCMALDYLSGVAVAAFFKSSNKTPGGLLDSRAGFRGLCRKGMVLVIVLLGGVIDSLLGTHCVREGVACAFILNEIISIVENAALMGVKVPSALKNAIEVLQQKSQGGDNNSADNK